MKINKLALACFALGFCLTVMGIALFIQECNDHPDFGFRKENKAPEFHMRIVKKDFGYTEYYFLEFTNDGFDWDVQTVGESMDFLGGEYNEIWFHTAEKAREYSFRFKSYEDCVNHNLREQAKADSVSNWYNRNNKNYIR